MHKALKIRDKIFSLVEGLESDSVIAQSCKGVEPPVAFPAVIVSLGVDEPLVQNANFIDWSLKVTTTVQARSIYDDMDVEIQAVREKLHEALFSEPELGLDYVISVEPLGMAEPYLSKDGDSYSVRADIAWQVYYRTSLASPSV